MFGRLLKMLLILIDFDTPGVKSNYHFCKSKQINLHASWIPFIFNNNILKLINIVNRNTCVLKFK